jgi:crotonobetainyl-CoA:carnitine CoA-transferase CaiB-like acyl-CoA transferase
MRAANPQVIYCSISGFGDDGPWRDYTAHGQTIDTLAGLVPVVPGDPQPTTQAGWRTAGTTLGGLFAALGVLAAVNARDRGADHAQYLSVSLWHAAMWWSWRDTTMLANAGKRWVDYTDLGSRYSLYTTADERVLLLAPIERKFWQPFCDIVGLDDHYRERGDWAASGMEFGEGPAFADERRAIADRLRARALDDWVPELKRAEIPFAPVLTVQEALAGEHAEINGVMRDTHLNGHTLQIPTSPVRIARDDTGFPPPGPMGPPPGIGEHTDELLRELGLRA